MMGSQSKKEQNAIRELALLRQQIAKLESLDSNRKRTEEKLRESEEKYKTITDAATAAIVMIDGQGKIVFWNPAAERIFGYTVEEAIGKELHLLMAPERYHAQYRKGFQRFKAEGHGPFIKNIIELTAARRDGTEFPIGLSLSAIKIKGQWNSIGIVRDITERKNAEEALRRAHDELEKRVAERTAELVEANRELEQQTLELAEANTALKVLLRQCGDARQDLEGKMLATINELVMPHLDRLSMRLASSEESIFIKIIKNNLEQITSSFSQKLTAKARNLTPREIQIADFIRNGHSTKEIADLLKVSQTTIETYRASLRKKLSITNKKVNLQTYLHSLQT